ncbi:MAG: RnfABCDGE type electron transport complex subunit D [Planctomycetota bacterium]|jgi:electron transport complex protein RnfD
MLSKITVSPAPHISQKLSTRGVMADVIIGLSPAMAAAVLYFRHQAVWVLATCIVSCVVSEWICNVIRRKPNTVGDLSAVLTGVILALSLPPTIPLWAAVLGSAFAIVITKSLFGGLGCNVFNPAMAARVFLTASFGALMTTWAVPATMGEVAWKGDWPKTMATIHAENVYEGSVGPISVTQATPLAWCKQVIRSEKKAADKVKAEAKASYGVLKDLVKVSFFGQVGGCLGETSSLALLIGGVYLLIRRTISFHIPAAVLISAFIFAELFYVMNPEKYSMPLLQLFGGGMLLCAFFIATDPVTAPLSVKGMWIFGAGVGVLIMLIRFLGEYPEGVMFAVLIMNAVTPLIDRACKLVPAGGKPNVN